MFKVRLIEFNFNGSVSTMTLIFKFECQLSGGSHHSQLLGHFPLHLVTHAGNDAPDGPVAQKFVSQESKKDGRAHSSNHSDTGPALLLAWTPYSVVSLIGQFGPPDALTPLATAVPAYFAKTAVVFDPIVYGFSHPHFRTSMKQLFNSISQNNSTVRIAVPLDMPTDRINSQVVPRDL